MIPFGDLARQHAALETELEAAVVRVLRSGRYILGSEGEAFERAFAAYVGASHAVGVANGTEALQLALAAVGVRAGDEVITAANTCGPTATAIVALGARPALVDVDPKTLTLDPRRIESAITPRTRALVPVHLYGQCARMEDVLEIAKRRGLEVVEDCAQAHGAHRHGRHAGTFGAAGAFSFYPSKNLGGAGDAGLVVCNDAELAAKLRRLRNHGKVDRYLHKDTGINSRLDEVQAAILSVKLGHLECWVERRRALARRYDEALHGAAEVVAPFEDAAGRHAYHLYVVQAANRERFRATLARAGIATEVHYPVPLHLQPAFTERLGASRALHVAERACETVVSVPLFPELAEPEVTSIVAALAEAGRG